MTMLPPLVTPADARQRLQDDGLLALGVTAPLLSPMWSAADPTFDPAALTLTMTPAGGVRPAGVAIRSWVSDLRTAGVYDVSGLPLTGLGAVLRFHPQAALRLEQLVAWRLGPLAGPVRPVPHTMVVRCQTNPDMTPQWFGPGDILDVDPADTPLASFHDERGLIIDPVAVAALFVDLVGALPALAPMGLLNTPGGVGNIATKATGITIHVVDPHGAPFRPVDSLAPVLVDAGGSQVDTLPASGLVTLPTGTGGQGVAPPGGGTGPGAARIRIGWGRNSTLDRSALYPPPLPAGVTLGHQFLRVCAVDLDWHLLGNRSAAQQHGVDPADQTIPLEFRPQVRDRVRLDFLVDGVDVLAAAGQALAPITAVGGWTGLAFAVSPTLETAVGVPPAPGPAGHWPTFPAPAAGGPPPAGQPNTGLTATWSGARDVVLTFPGGTIPVGFHVRVYPQVFQTITSIGPAPSFLRGDGAAALVTAPGPFSVLLVNPLGLPDGSNQPPGQVLTLDLTVTDRTPATVTFGNVVVPVNPGSPPAVTDQFAAPDALGPASGAVLQSIGPSPVFGIPRTGPPPATGMPTSVVDLLRRLAQETTPRVGPRLPTMAAFPTLFVVGTGPTSAPMAWDAVVSGGRWGRETRSADHVLGNPGNPAGPDVHAAGVRTDGAAAFDVAQIALRRTQPLVPFVLGVPGWLPFVANTGWVAPPEPASDAAPAGQPAPRTCAAAVLRTTPVGCEEPVLTVVPMPDPNASVQNLVNDIANELNVTPPSTPVGNEPQIVREIRRAFHWSRFGSRDAQWALRRAVRQARDAVVVVSPQFSATAYPPDPPGPLPPYAADLVAELAARMTEQPSLLVLVCVPRWPDAAPAYGGWIRQAFKARNAALKALTDVDPNRVVAFHPNGFPGRPAAVRSTVVIVDDVWALVGTSHWRRRGMTFDEGVDVVGFDRTLDETGASRRIRLFRQALLAALTGVRAPGPGVTDPDWVRLAGLRSCVDLVADLVGQGGLGRLAPFWSGPTDSDVLAQSDAVADPDGGTSDEYLLRFASLIGESPA